MFRYFCYGHKNGGMTQLQVNSLAHAEEWVKQNTEGDKDSFIWDVLAGKRV
ncbi:MAG: hypothetical protein WAV48_05000 [Candidatus Magasanikiibacteriota bacterium]